MGTLAISQWRLLNIWGLWCLDYFGPIVLIYFCYRQRPARLLSNPNNPHSFHFTCLGILASLAHQNSNLAKSSGFDFLIGNYVWGLLVRRQGFVPDQQWLNSYGWRSRRPPPSPRLLNSCSIQRRHCFPLPN